MIRYDLITVQNDNFLIFLQSTNAVNMQLKNPQNKKPKIWEY